MVSKATTVTIIIKIIGYRVTVYFLPKCANQAVAPNKAKPAKSWFDAPNIGQIALQVPLKASAPPTITVIIVATYLLERAGAHPAVSSSKAYLPNLVAVSSVVSKKADTVKAPKAIPVCSGNPKLAKKLPIP